MNRWSTLVVCGATLALVACGAGSDDGNSGPSGAGASASGGSGGDFAGVGGGSGGGTCSADLQSVVDDSGNVIMTCPPDQGCLDGQCVPACEAAAGSQGSIGCEYWTPDPPFTLNGNPTGGYAGTCYAVFVANTWSRPAQISVTFDGQSYDISAFGRIPSGIGAATQYSPIPASGIPPNEVAVLFLSHRPGAIHPFGFSLECPVTPAVIIDAAVHGSGRGRAFEVISDTPITAYDILPYGGATSFLPSATLLFPRTAWGDNYVVTAPQNVSSGINWMMLVGTVDGTTVDVLSPTALPAGGAAPAIPAATPTQVTLGAGEMLQWTGADPSGAILGASQPIGVFSGVTTLRVITATSPDGGGTDHNHQQLPPVAALAHEYVGGGVVTRQASLAPESVLYRIVGIVAGTTLEYDPPIAAAPTTLEQGQAIQFEASEIFVVRSQDEDHPFMLSHYMAGASGLTREGCDPMSPLELDPALGDEEWVVLAPPAQFLQRYVFFTDPTYATTTLVVTRKRQPGGAFADVNVECLGTVTGWQPVGGSDYEVAHVDLYRAWIGAQPACETSRHAADSAGAFGVVVWGTDLFASYGYPAGGNVGAINDVVVVPR
jgi:hypothetical protein